MRLKFTNFVVIMRSLAKFESPVRKGKKSVN